MLFRPCEKAHLRCNDLFLARRHYPLLDAPDVANDISACSLGGVWVWGTPNRAGGDPPHRQIIIQSKL